MKTSLIRSLVVVISSLVFVKMAYAQSGMGGCCGGSTPATTANLTCGNGTYQVNGQCVPIPTSGTTTTGSNVQANPSNTPQNVNH